MTNTLGYSILFPNLLKSFPLRAFSTSQAAKDRFAIGDGINKLKFAKTSFGSS
jgi:hypothetical protein